MTTRLRQLAITKTPALHGTYCLRLALNGGATLEYISHRAQTFDELVEALSERIADIERMQQATGEATSGDRPEAVVPKQTPDRDGS